MNNKRYRNKKYFVYLSFQRYKDNRHFVYLRFQFVGSFPQECKCQQIVNFAIVIIRMISFIISVLKQCGSTYHIQERIETETIRQTFQSNQIQTTQCRNYHRKNINYIVRLFLYIFCNLKCFVQSKSFLSKTVILYNNETFKISIFFPVTFNVKDVNKRHQFERL